MHKNGIIDPVKASADEFNDLKGEYLALRNQVDLSSKFKYFQTVPSLLTPISAKTSSTICSLLTCTRVQI